MPYRHGFLTKRLRRYLVEDKKGVPVHKRNIYDHHVRETLKQALDEAVFVLERMDKKEFDKISYDCYREILHLLLVFAERYYVDVPLGRIRKYRKLVYATHILDASNFFLQIGNLILQNVAKERKEAKKPLG